MKEKIKELMDAVVSYDKEKLHERFSGGDLYRTLYKGLDSIGELDYDYLNNMEKIKGTTLEDKMKNLQNFTFKECCTLLTAILRSDRFVEGLFNSVVISGDVLRLLTHAYDIL